MDGILIKISNIIIFFSVFYSSFGFSKQSNHYSDPVFFSQEINNNKIRVKVAKRIKSIFLTSNGEIDISLFNNKDKDQILARKFKFNCQFSKKFKQPTALFATLKSNDFFIFNNKEFKGDMSVITSGNDGCDLINTVDIDYYISTLLSREMNKAWPVEALKAQAVAARSYALSKKHENKSLLYDLESSEKHQVSGTFKDVSSKTFRAAMETKSLVLKNKQDEIVPAFYHASCGGELFLPRDVWDGVMSGYQRRQCSYCKGFKNLNWKFNFSINELIKILSLNLPNLNSFSSKDLKFFKGTKTSLIFKQGKESVILKKSIIRKYFGRRKMRSNNFTFSMKGKRAYVSGKGNGHGVGMCQLGALKMAKQGFSFDKILKYYYPELKLERMSQ